MIPTYSYTFEKDGFEVIVPAESSVRVELTGSQLEAVMGELAGKGSFGGCWPTLRDACYAVGVNPYGRRA